MSPGLSGLVETIVSHCVVFKSAEAASNQYHHHSHHLVPARNTLRSERNISKTITSIALAFHCWRLLESKSMNFDAELGMFLHDW